MWTEPNSLIAIQAVRAAGGSQPTPPHRTFQRMRHRLTARNAHRDGQGAEGPRHRVTPIGLGERTILKFVYTAGGDKLPDFYAHIDSFPGARPSTRQKQTKAAAEQRQRARDGGRRARRG